MPFISIGLVTWNSARYLPTCLGALSNLGDVDIELIVVDNDSRDDSLQIVANFFPQAKIIQNTTNRGFCDPHNQAIQSSNTPYYMPLNPDIQLHPGYLAGMVEALEAHPRNGMSAGKLLLGTPTTTNNLIDSTGLFIDRKRRQYLRGHGEIDQGQYDSPGEVFGVDGSAPLYRREMLDDIKINGEYFDEAFFAHKEDVDLAWRARIFGWKCVYTPKAVAFHDRQFRPGKRKGLSSEIRLDAVKNRYFLLLKNETKEGWRRDWLPILWYDIKILAYLFAYERTSLKAIGMVKKNWPRLKNWRNEIMNRKRVSPQETLKWFR
jgi:GT2 family glycosyltransferase